MPPIRPLSVSETAVGPEWRPEQEGLSAEDGFLLAAATERPELLPEEIDDAERLLARIAEHRLMGRCRRLRPALEARGYPGELMTSIDTLCRASESEFRRNGAAVEGVYRALGEGLGVMIKGFSSFLLTGDDATLRCGDVDLVVPDGNPVIAHLLSTGYAQTRAPFMHELGEFTRDGVEFDLQRGFPVSRYPHGKSGLGDRAITPWGLVQACEIGFDDLRRARVAVSTDGGRLWVPSLEMAVLIAAAHAFMNYTNVWSISHRKKAWLRLAELADIREMALAPGFSRARFKRLVERFRAHDVVAWTDWIWTRLGSGPVLAGGGCATRADFPLNLWWNLWIASRPAIASLLTDRWYPLADLARQIEAACRDPQPEHFGERRTLTPLWEAPGRRGVIRATTRRTRERFEIALDGLPPRALLRLRLEAPGIAEELVFPSEAGTRRVLGGTAPVLVEASGASLAIEVDTAAGWGGTGFLGLLIEEGGDIALSALAPLRDR